MKSWPTPFLPAVPGTGPVVRVHDTASDAEVSITPRGPARMYVCGITPYDATHLGHAATYLTFDLLGRALRDAGHDVVYAQNITDVDDPLLERAERDGITWEELAAKEIALFREDMTALGIIPPDHYIGVVESIEPVVRVVERLMGSGAAYAVPVPDGSGHDTYFDLTADPQWGGVSGWSREQMLAVFADRGGDPDREGKRDPLDPLLWRAHRDGEPSWDGGSLGSGRPGWHVECTTIALDELGMGFDVQGGGSDLIFPHHEMSASQAVALTGERPFAQAYVHQGMVGYQGEKMSKSKGNLVLVSALRHDGVDPMAIRLALLAHHYREDWEWTDRDLSEAQARLERWRGALSVNVAPSSDQTVEAVRAALSTDLDSPAALAAVDDWASATLAPDDAPTDTVSDGWTNGAPGVLARALDALLGVRV